MESPYKPNHWVILRLGTLISFLAFSVNALHVRYSFSEQENTPTKFVGNNLDDTIAPEFSFPGGNNDPELLPQGLYFKEDKYLAPSMNFNSSATGSISFEFWVYIFDMESFPVFKGTAQTMNGTVPVGFKSTICDEAAYGIQFTYEKLAACGSNVMIDQYY